MKNVKKIDLSKPVDAYEMKRRLLSIVREYNRYSFGNVDEVVAYSEGVVKKNFTTKKGMERFVSESLALFLMGHQDNDFAKVLNY
jgi:hypothetical protein